jgi:hypothetical protein
MSREILEVQAIFPSDAALQEAMSKLALAGYDRADLSLPHTTPPGAEATPEQGADNPEMDVDKQQMRTLHASGAGSAAALLAAGVVIGTGGAAAPAVAAAVAAGAGGALLTEAGSHVADAAQHDSREAAARAGRLVLAVRLRDEKRTEDALDIMRRAGATRAEAVRRVDNAIDAASWTG